ncbi:hypothetical protein GCM10007939_20280 [Amylibacter marinus]|uniref:Uncharacterized protein n=1 Tax=Amylibacter marinus TaxID=1475483 RepID=A0ABQ5VWL4_9RHOB|nr:hypothetical protein GCM10007939_20280 [Amylibacter marinus]
MSGDEMGMRTGMTYTRARCRNRPRDCMRRVTPKTTGKCWEGGETIDPRVRRPALQNGNQEPSGMTGRRKT